jgi:hypothetical protein
MAGMKEKNLALEVGPAEESYYAILRTKRVIDEDPSEVVFLMLVVNTPSQDICESVLVHELTVDDPEATRECFRADGTYAPIFYDREPMGEYYLLSEIEGQYPRAIVFRNELENSEDSEELRYDAMEWLVEEMRDVLDEKGVKGVVSPFSPTQKLDI